MKALLRFMAISAVIGIAVAVAVNAFWSIYKQGLPTDYYLPVFKTSLVLFPAYIGTMAISGTSYWSADTFVLIGYNAIVYAIFGLLTWLGLHKNKLFFALEALLLIALFVGIWKLR